MSHLICKSLGVAVFAWHVPIQALGSTIFCGVSIQRAVQPLSLLDLAPCRAQGSTLVSWEGGPGS